MPDLTLQVAAGNSDAWYMQNAPFDKCHRTESTVRFGAHDMGVSNWSRDHAGFHFTSVPLDDKITIVTARLYLKATSTATPTVDVHLGCEDVDNAADFLGGSCDASARTMTTAYTAWASATTTAGAWFYSDDFAAAVQEVIDRGGWSYNNALAVLLVRQVETGDHCDVYAYENASADAAKLVITYKYKHFAGTMI